MPLTHSVRRWPSPSAPRAAMHIVHGMAEHSGRYADFATRLNAAGTTVWAHDHRGHGNNPTPPVGLGHFGDEDGFRRLIDDAWEVTQELRAAVPGVPVLLFAHSMGSFVGQYLMSEHGDAYGGVILSGTNGPPGLLEAVARGLAHAERAIRGGRTHATWVTRAVFDTYNRQFAPARTDADWLSRDAAAVDRYLADPLCGTPLTTQSWVDFLDAKPRLGDAAFLGRIPRQLPVRIMVGSSDPVADNGVGAERLRALYQRAGLGDVTLRVYEDARHELLNETNRDEVIRDLLDWIDRVIAQRR